MTSQCKWPILFQTLNLGNETVRLSVQKIDFQDRMVSKHKFIRTLHKQVGKTSMSRLLKVSLDNPLTSTYMARKLYFVLMNW